MSINLKPAEKLGRPPKKKSKGTKALVAKRIAESLFVEYCKTNNQVVANRVMHGHAVPTVEEVKKSVAAAMERAIDCAETFVTRWETARGRFLE